ncbi:NAD(P)/FAD-dependent oxidoreductase [Aquimarina sp. RZ0]|uniref:NAD(P)/FAD-dependent oxidoreductase n=1 Tax=Aquimarina sp. RZ0 TaxID=2607730 RepID=UPI0011F3B071|nr:NAD(P)/FAD-dependent oxidoreductase [Aquimarina sp. RZ0]KAA1242607.1 NAD(P)/FAD-dependent oxidoreductase [Aquimarina sp. RZ0]
MKPNKKVAIIIGCGPAGLTAAYEFLKHTDIHPVILEMSEDIGGISKTVNYKGNYIDIGGHRFFSKSDVVMDWWQDIMPVESTSGATQLGYQNKSKTYSFKNEVDDSKDVFLIRNRVSHIFFMRKLFDYPLKINLGTIKKFGFSKIFVIGISYVWNHIFPNTPEKTLEDFFINRFGKKLYKIFFKDYTEKVWGVPCDQIPSEWGKQRIKGLNIIKALKHAVSNLRNTDDQIEQKNTETSLIERFLYPKYGPGQLWTKVAEKIVDLGGEIHFNTKVTTIVSQKNMITTVISKNNNGENIKFSADYVISTMPIRYLIRGMGDIVPKIVKEVAKTLVYRDFITVGLLLDRINLEEEGILIKDNWIYIQERSVSLGRLQIFNNWSPYLVSDSSKVWLGLEYFCNEGDNLWSMSDRDFIQFAIEELVSIDVIKSEDVIDHTIIRMPKTYPSYFGSYKDFDQIKNYVSTFPNLFLIGRNGMHKYNNQDHSMLTAITAVQNIKNGQIDKENIWDINTEQEYHEEASE